MQINAILVRTGELPKVISIENSTSAFAEVIGTPKYTFLPIEKGVVLLYGSSDENIAITTKSLNRRVYNYDGKVKYLIYGDFIIVAGDGYDFWDLPNEKIVNLTEMFMEIPRENCIGDRVFYLAYTKKFMKNIPISAQSISIFGNKRQLVRAMSQANMATDTLVKIAKYYEVTADYLLGLTNTCEMVENLKYRIARGETYF